MGCDKTVGWYLRLWKFAFLLSTAPQGHFVASLGRARSLCSLAKPLIEGEFTTPINYITLSELEFGETPNSGGYAADSEFVVWCYTAYRGKRVRSR